LESQTIEIKNEFKPYEILAICLHFYNQGNYTSKVDNYYPSSFKFNTINNIIYEENPNFKTNTYEFPGGKYTFEFENDRGSYNKTPWSKFVFKYNGIWLTFKYRYYEKKWNQYEILNTEIKSGTTRSYKLDIEEEKTKFYDIQNKIVQKLKFYDESSQYLTNFIRMYSYSSLTLDYVYGFKNYIDNIIKYQTSYVESSDSLSKLINCVEFDMQKGITYNFKILKFKKNSYNSFTITINKSYEIMVYNNTLSDIISRNAYHELEPAFKVIIPVFEQIGGVDELKNVILHNRILTE